MKTSEIKNINRQLNILFLGAAKKVSLAENFLDSARKLNVALTLYSYELNHYVPITSIAEIIVGLKWDDPDIIDELSEMINKLSINIVIPCMDPAILVAAKLKEKFSSVFIPVSSYSDCVTFFDKQKANDWFVENCIRVPETNNTLPFIAKPKGGSASKGIIIVASEMEKAFFYKKYKQADYIIQRFITGEEYTVDCYVSRRGRILSVVPRIRLEVVSGEVTRSRTTRDEKIIAVSKEILEKSKLIGPINIQYIRESVSGELFLIEINPRFGGGVLCSIQAGANIPHLLLSDYYDKKLKPIESWQENLLMTRCYREFFYLCK